MEDVCQQSIRRVRKLITTRPFVHLDEEGRAIRMALIVLIAFLFIVAFGVLAQFVHHVVR